MLKGWFQTWLTHMRAPLRLHRELGVADAIAFHLIVAGQVLSAAAFLPSLVLLALQATGLVPLFVDGGLDADVLVFAALGAFVSGVVGAFVLAVSVADEMRRRLRLGDVLSMPLYWCAISLATYAALVELIRAPDRWNKTEHGLVARRAVTRADAPPSADDRSSTAGPCAEPLGEAKREGLERV